MSLDQAFEVRLLVAVSLLDLKQILILKSIGIADQYLVPCAPLTLRRDQLPVGSETFRRNLFLEILIRRLSDGLILLQKA